MDKHKGFRLFWGFVCIGDVMHIYRLYIGCVLIYGVPWDHAFLAEVTRHISPAACWCFWEAMKGWGLATLAPWQWELREACWLLAAPLGRGHGELQGAHQNHLCWSAEQAQVLVRCRLCIHVNAIERCLQKPSSCLMERKAPFSASQGRVELRRPWQGVWIQSWRKLLLWVPLWCWVFPPSLCLSLTQSRLAEKSANLREALWQSWCAFCLVSDFMWKNTQPPNLHGSCFS